MPDAYESFNKVDSTVLGPNHTWTWLQGIGFKVQSNRVMTSSVSAQEYARCDVVLDRDDHYAEIEIVTLNATAAGNTTLGPMVRVTNVGTAIVDLYSVEIDSQSVFWLTRFVNGVQTTLTNEAITIGSLPGVLRLEVSGSTLRCYWKGTLFRSWSDTGLPGAATNRSTGFRMWQGNNSTAGDNFYGRSLVKVLPTISGAVTATGAVLRARMARRSWTGAVVTSGVVSTIKRPGRTFVGSVTAQHVALRKIAAKTRTGAITPAGVIRRTTKRAFAGAMTVAGLTTPAFLGAVFMRAGSAIMKIRRAGEVRMRFRRR